MAILSWRRVFRPSLVSVVLYRDNRMSSVSRVPLELYFKNFPFIKKTVIVKENDFNAAYQALQKIMRTDKVTNTINVREYYTKPTRWRKQIMYERCKRIYDSEMTRKINFVMRTNRVDPWPR